MTLTEWITSLEERIARLEARLAALESSRPATTPTPPPAPWPGIQPHRQLPYITCQTEPVATT